MRYIDKSHRCLQFDEYIIQYTPSSWAEFNGEVKLTLHQHLWIEQGTLCIYCQQQVPPKAEKQASAQIRSHIEHIHPRQKFPQFIFEYKNLSISCEGFDCYSTAQQPKREFCEHRKGDEYDSARFLNPIELQDIESYFEYDFEGRIYPTAKDKARAEYMIDILNLNHPTLIGMRKSIYEAVIYPDNPLDIRSEFPFILPAFYSMLKQFGLI